METTDKVIELMKCQEIKLWRMHMTNMDEVTKNLNIVGLKLFAIMTDKNWSHVMIIYEAANNS